MSTSWPIKRLGEVLRLDLDRVPIDASVSYPMVGVLSFGRGLFERETVENGKTSYRIFYRLKAEHIVMSQLFGWEGALALSDKKFAGRFLSPQFPTFLCDVAKLDREFLGWLMRRPAFWEDLGSRASGMGDRRRTLNPEALFKCEIPLPPLAVQRRIVARIEELTIQIHEARTIRRLATEEAEALPRKLADQMLDSELMPRTPLRDLLSEPLMNGLSVPASRLGSGINFAKVGVVNSGIFNAEEIKLVDIDLAPDSQYWLRKGDIVVSRGNSAEFVGRAAIYEGKPAMCAMPDLLIRVRLDPMKADTRFVSAFFHTSEARQYVASQISGTSSTMPKISQSKLEALPVPVPPLAEQRRIVAELDALQAEVNALKRLQAESAAELDALLPSILDKALKGELFSEVRIEAQLGLAGIESTIIDIQPLLRQKAALSAYFAHKLRFDSHLGHVKMEKLDQFAEAECGLNLGRQPQAMAAGPADIRSRNAVEEEAKKQKWYSVVKHQQPAGQSRYEYVIGPQIAEAIPIAEKFMGHKKQAIDRLITLLKPLDTHQCSVIATLHSAWNDLLRLQRPVSDDAVIQASIRSHKEKKGIPMKDWHWGLDWLRKNDMVPQGAS